MDEIVREFLVESYENLDQLDQDLVALEEAPGSSELLGRVFRTIHTIKGTCGFLAFGRLERLTHAGESLLSDLRDGRRAMDQLTTDVLLQMVDTVREILASIESTGAEGDIVVEVVIEQMRGLLETPEAGTVPDGRLESAGSELFADDLGSPTASDSSIRVDVDVLDSLMRQVGELVLARNQITRLAAGKHASGLLTLRAYHAGGQVIVEVVDDGQGIDAERVAATAVQRRLRTPNQVAAMSEPEVLQLLFLPGFSMAATVTNVSGRGVGMDVVHTKIGAIGGTVEVESTVGRGRTWRLSR